MRLKRRPDYWELRACAGWDPVSGKKRYVTRVFRGGKREANSMLAQLVAEVDRAGPRTEGTVGYLLDARIDHLAARGRQQRTINGYRTIARAIEKDPLSAMPLKRVTVKSVDDFYNRLNHRKLSPSTIQRYHALLGAAFQQAMAWGWLPTNVVRLATPPSVPRIARKIPTPEVLAAILREAQASRNPENHLAFRLLATTGAQRGEICGVRWSAVDLDRNRISIREAIAHLATGELQHKDPKSHQIREVAIDARTAEMLRAHRLDQLAYAANVRAELARDAFALADLLTDSSGLTPIPPNRLTQAFRRIIERVPGADKVRLHDLRHWFASTQLDAGEPLQPSPLASEMTSRLSPKSTRRKDKEETTLRLPLSPQASPGYQFLVVARIESHSSPSHPAQIGIQACLTSDASQPMTGPPRYWTSGR